MGSHLGTKKKKKHENCWRFHQLRDGTHWNSLELTGTHWNSWNFTWGDPKKWGGSSSSWGYPLLFAGGFLWVNGKIPSSSIAGGWLGGPPARHGRNGIHPLDHHENVVILQLYRRSSPAFSNPVGMVETSGISSSTNGDTSHILEVEYGFNDG